MRDPRTDPQSGDILRLGDKRRLIEAIRHPLDSSNEYSLLGYRTPMESYRESAASAEVERVGWPEDADEVEM